MNAPMSSWCLAVLVVRLAFLLAFTCEWAASFPEALSFEDPLSRGVQALACRECLVERCCPAHTGTSPYTPFKGGIRRFSSVVAPPSGMENSSPKVRFEHGKQLLEQGKFEQAAAEFREVLKSTPNAPLLYNLLGFCDLQLGLKDEAVAHFKKAIALKPDYKAAHNNLGGIYLMEGRSQEASQEFSAVIQIDPKDAQAYYNLARAELTAHQKTTALEHLKRAYDLALGNLPITLALAKVYLEIGQKELGRPFARELMGASVSDASTHFELGNLLLSYDLEEAAEDHFHKALWANPKMQETIFDYATAHFKNQSYKATIKMLGSLKTLMQSSAAWHEMVGYSLFKLGDPAQAAVELQKAMDLDSHNEDYVLELSEVFVTHNNSAAAISLLETAIKAFPNSARIWFGYGVACMGDEKRDLAEVALKRSLQLDPTLDLAYVVMGQGYKEAGQWELLLESARQLIQLNPKHYAGYYYNALALLRLTPSDASPDPEVERLLKKSIELQIEDPEPHYELAKLLAKEGKKEASLRELERIVQVAPDFGPAYYQLIRLYREKGDMEKSQEAQKAHEKIKLLERDRVMKKLIVEVQQRSKR